MATYYDLTYDHNKVFDSVVIPIYKPAGRARGRIIAFHGPGGSWKKSWSTGSSLWLQDRLPKKFPNCAIYSINLRSSTAEWYTQRLDQGSKTSSSNFINHIKYHLKATSLEERAPIVFIAYGLAGVYLKQLIPILWDPQGWILSCTPQLDELKGAVFISTPQRFNQEPLATGTSSSNLSSNFSVDPDCVHDLESWTKRMEGITKNFQEFVKREKIEVKYADGPPPPRNLGDDGVNLGEFVTKNEEAIFEQLTAAFGVDVLSHDRDWDPLQVSFRGEQPLSRRRRRNPKEGPNLKNTLESWIHFPVNHAARMNEAIAPSIIRSNKLRSADLIGIVQQARSNLPHSRYIQPMCDVIQDRDGPALLTHVRIALPYLHWDTLAGATAYSHDVREAHSATTTEHLKLKLESLSSLLKSVLVKVRDPLYHPRRTLDQFAYPGLKDTRRRDASQVVSKLTGQEKLEGGAKMIMVDQLWLCLRVEERAYGDVDSSTVVTSFPHTSYARSDKDPPGLYTIADIRQEVLTKLEKRAPRGPIKNTFDDAEYFQEFGATNNRPPLDGADVASLILSSALLVLSSMRNSARKDWSLDFLEIFQEAIANVTEQHNKYFEDFNESLKAESVDTNFQNAASKTRKLKEVQLSMEISDIIDELGMLKQLFETQKDCLQNGHDKMSKAHCLSGLADEISLILKTIEGEYLASVLSMTKEAERIQRSILDLLDIEQKEASIHEAQYGNLQTQSLNQHAVFSAKQAQAAQAQQVATELQSQILFLFTLATIIFLPLSFISSYYGMNIIESIEDGKTNARNYPISYVKKTMGGASAGITGVFLIGAGIWYQRGRKLAKEEATKNLLKMEKQGYLPSGLIDDDEYARMHEYEEKRKQRGDSTV